MLRAFGAEVHLCRRACRMLIGPGSIRSSTSLLLIFVTAVRLGKSPDGKLLIRPASRTALTMYAKSASFTESRADGPLRRAVSFAVHQPPRAAEY